MSKQITEIATGCKTWLSSWKGYWSYNNCGWFSRIKWVERENEPDSSEPDKMSNKWKKKCQKKSWTLIAQQCVSKYNDTIHSVTGFSPSYLMYGKQLDTVPIEVREQNYFMKDWKIALFDIWETTKEIKKDLKGKGICMTLK